MPRKKISKLGLSITKKSLYRFFILVIIIGFYWGYISSKYGTKHGSLITLLTWSFFVFCTPIADAGFLIDFPVRLLTKIRMLYSEMIVWTFAFFLNFIVYFTNKDIYSSTIILKLFEHIISHPFPFWLIIILSAAGTFLSIHFGDEFLDVLYHKRRKDYFKHRRKYQMILILFIIAAIIVIYDFLIHEIGIAINMF